MLGGEGREGGAVAQAAETAAATGAGRGGRLLALPPTEAAARAGERAAQKIFDKGGGVEAAATEAGRAASLTAMARGLSIADAAAASRDARAAVTGD